MTEASEGLRQRIEADMKTAMRAKDKDRLGTIRLILAAIKQREVDERITLGDPEILAVLDKMVKQRRDSISQFENWRTRKRPRCRSSRHTCRPR
jgi:uncharacterized protein YqeY